MKQQLITLRKDYECACRNNILDRVWQKHRHDKALKYAWEFICMDGKVIGYYNLPKDQFILVNLLLLDILIESL